MNQKSTTNRSYERLGRSWRPLGSVLGPIAAPPPPHRRPIYSRTVRSTSTLLVERPVLPASLSDPVRSCPILSYPVRSCPIPVPVLPASWSKKLPSQTSSNNFQKISFFHRKNNVFLKIQGAQDGLKSDMLGLKTQRLWCIVASCSLHAVSDCLNPCSFHACNKLRS